MTEDKTGTRELVWLYSLRQASLLVDTITATSLITHGEWHIDALGCPCMPWDPCQCPCHLENMAPSAAGPKTPAA